MLQIVHLQRMERFSVTSVAYSADSSMMRNIFTADLPNKIEVGLHAIFHTKIYKRNDRNDGVER